MSASEPPGEALIGTVLAGRYRIDRLLGTGGMGAVYRAEHVHMRKAVAVKVLHREMTLFPEVVARFEREAVVAGRIEHPNVAAATDFGRLDDGAFYLVLEFVEGQSLGKLIEELGRVPEERALRITRQIAAALAAAHAKQVVHRDLKPDNVMLVRKDDGQDFVKVLDFGIAKIKLEEASDQPALTQAGTVFGTPEYMSPEQARGDPVDTRSDLYTLGMMLYEMLAGQSPFKDDDLVVILTRQLTMDPPPLPADVSQATSDLVMQLLKKSPVDRLQTAAAVMERLDLLLGGSPPPSAVAAVSVQGPASAEAPAASVRIDTVVAPKAAYAPTMLNVATTARRSAGEIARAVSLRALPVLKKPVHIRGRGYPLWMPLGALVGLVVAGFFVSVWAMSERVVSPVDGKTVVEAVSKPKDDELKKLVERAESGDRTALAELNARDEGDRSGLEWRALGHGYATIDEFPSALRAYKAGIAAHSGLAHDPIVVSDLRRAIEREETSEGALELTLSALGATGADLIYALWEGSKGSQQKAALNKRLKALIDSDKLWQKASPALQVLIELPRVQKADRCKGIKEILPRITELADDRAVPALKRFKDRRGCGFLGLSDCYGCLRKGEDLANAIAAAESRKGPEFFGITAPEKPASTGKPR